MAGSKAKTKYAEGKHPSLEELAQKHGKRITAKQKMFCDEYLVDFNATQAAIRAGYSKKTAKAIGAENLTKPIIKEYIENRIAEKESQLIAKQDEVMKYLTAVMRREKSEFIVVTIKEERQEYAPDDSGTYRKQTVKIETPQVVEIPAMLRDANRAAELLGKTYGIYDKERLELDYKRLELEKQRLEMEKQKAETSVPDKEIKVVIAGYEEDWSE